MFVFQETTPEQFVQSPFYLIGKEWMLITAEKDKKINTMTASWGGLGVMWNKSAAFIVVRPQRYTKEFIDSADTFSISFYNECFRETMTYIGTTSGRQQNKIAEAHLTVLHDGKTPYFEEADGVLICRKMYAQPIKPEYFIDKEADKKWYPDKDYHTLYIAEIQKILMKV